MKPLVRLQLILMMFLLFFTWGAWYGQMSKYMLETLHANGNQIGNAYLAFSIATIIAPILVGMIADKFFAAQKVMGFLNIMGAIVLFLILKVTDPDQFFWYILAYTITFTPNLALSSSIAMNQMQNPEKEFPFIRVFGTAAWIIVTNLVGYLNIGHTVEIFQISMITSLALGVYAFTLPDTPPHADKNTSLAQIFGADSFVLFKDKSFLVFFISSILICIPLSFYYALANPSLTASHMTKVENKMSLGQVSEVFFMLILPFAFSKFGVKKILIIGLIAWIIRFLCFGFGDGLTSEWILYVGILLHGICYDFFFVTGQIYTDNKAGAKIKNSAQALITLATYGIGMGIGSKISGLVLDHYKIAENVFDYKSVWMIPAYIAAAVLVLFVLFFKDNTRKLHMTENLNDKLV